VHSAGHQCVQQYPGQCIRESASVSRPPQRQDIGYPADEHGILHVDRDQWLFVPMCLSGDLANSAQLGGNGGKGHLRGSLCAGWEYRQVERHPALCGQCGGGEKTAGRSHREVSAGELYTYIPLIPLILIHSY
jgi:hypothetical protein